MGSSAISLGLGLGGGKSATSSGTSGGGGGYSNTLSSSLDGTDDYLEVPRDDGLNNSTLSLSAWVKFDVVNTTQCIIGKRTSAIGVYFQLLLYNGKLEFYNHTVVTDARVLSADTWYHIAVVHTGGTGGTTVIYIDGSGVSFNNTNTGDLLSTSTLAIGRLNSSSGRYMNGLIDEVGVWTTALSAPDISTIYNSGVPGDISSLSPYYYYRMGDGIGDVNSSSGAPANGGTIGTIVNQGSASRNASGVNGPTFSDTVPS